MTEEEYKKWFAKKGYKNKKLILASEFVGCFYCLKIYGKTLIKEWVDRGETAVCPKCGIDAVVPFNLSNHEEESIDLHNANQISFK